MDALQANSTSTMAGLGPCPSLLAQWQPKNYSRPDMMISCYFPTKSSPLRPSQPLELHHFDPLHALSIVNTHQCVLFLENQLCAKDRILNLDCLPSPGLFSTHIPFHSLPNSIIKSGCRIVYLCRNPKDNFVTLCHFAHNIRVNSGGEPLPLEVGFDWFFNGLCIFGPYWDHVLGYWEASLESDKYRVLFMRYGEVMEDPVAELKRLAELIGCPFTSDEEKDGVAESISQLCGFENSISLEVNKIGTTEMVHGALENNMLFRHGGTGDWMNHLTPEMVQQVDNIMESMFRGSGLTF